MKHSFFHSGVWFVALWYARVAGAALLALPFRVLAKMSMQSLH